MTRYHKFFARDRTWEILIAALGFWLGLCVGSM